MGPLQLCHEDGIKNLHLTSFTPEDKSGNVMDLRNSSQYGDHITNINRGTVLMPRGHNTNYRSVIASGSSQQMVPSPTTSCEWGPETDPYEMGLSRKRKKTAQPIPDECKDDAYWERRKRNNESAKRSRELRRRKEQMTSVRVTQLEQENLKLRTEVGILREEVARLRQMFYTKETNESSS